MQKKLSQFLLRFSFIRYIRSFIYIIGPWLKYVLYILLFAGIMFLPTLLSQKQEGLILLKTKIVNKYISFINYEDSYIRVKITGNEYTKHDEVSDIINSKIDNFLNIENDSQTTIKSIKGDIEELPWVKNVIISRNLPNDLMVTIEEYKPFAIWQGKNETYIINKNGRTLIKLDKTNKSDFPDLLVLSGKEANLNVIPLFNILVTDLEISKNVYSATWVGMRRWNIRFNNNLLAKLPEINVNEAWKKLINIYNTPGSLIGLEVIDLRVNDKIYLKYGDDMINDLKSL